MTGTLSSENIEQSFDQHHYCICFKSKQGYSEHKEIESYEYPDYSTDPRLKIFLQISVSRLSFIFSVNIQYSQTDPMIQPPDDKIERGSMPHPAYDEGHDNTYVRQ